MGVEGLWSLFPSRTATLASLAEDYGHSEGFRGLRLGIDAFNLLAIICRGDKATERASECV